MTDPEKFNKKMKAQKENIDESIKKADRDKGLVVVLTGNGKGKSSSAFGMAARAMGHGMNPVVAQFIKGRTDTGEETFFKHLMEWHVLGEGFTWDTQNFEKDKKTAQDAWNNVVVDLFNDEEVDVIILDELTYPLKYGWLDLETVLREIQGRRKEQHVIITGRGAPQELIDIADTVTVMQDKKHAYNAGIKAQKGIDL